MIVNSPTKRRMFLITLLHSIPTTFFMYGTPFYTTLRYGWGASQNLLAQALIGFGVAIGALAGGQIAHATRPQRAIAIGLIGCLLAALLGLVSTQVGGPPLLLTALFLLSVSQAVGWPGIESGLMENEPHAVVQNYVSYFNLTWSFGTATAFLIATPLMRWLGLPVLFVLPAIFYAANLLLLSTYHAPAAAAYQSSENDSAEGDFARDDYTGNVLAKNALDSRSTPVLSPSTDRDAAAAVNAHVTADAARVRGDAYRWLGWLANPLAFIAINVIVSYNPTIQARLHFSLAMASIWCGLWFYVRMIAFELLRRWTWWHYKWGFLCGAFAVTMVSFAALVGAPNLAVLLIAQIVFGLCVGLIYQSSLFYSMADSDAQGAHGGFHESFIGVGILVGPLIAYSGTLLAPKNAALPVGMALGGMGLSLAVLIALGLRTRSSAIN